MAQDEVVIKYVADVSGLKPVIAEVAKVTDLNKDLTAESKKVFADKTLDQAIDKMASYSTEVENATETQKSLTAQLKEMKRTLASLDENSVEFAKLSAEAGKLEDKIGDVRAEVKRLSSDTRAIDGLVEGARGIAAAFSIAQGAAALFGSENKNIEKAILKTQAAMALLNGVQELGQQLTQKNTLLNRAYAFSLGVVQEIQESLKVSSVAAWGAVAGGIGLVVAAGAGLISWLMDSQDETDKLTEAEKEHNKELQKRLEFERQLADNSLMSRRGYIGTDEVIARLKKGMDATTITTTELNNAYDELQKQLQDVQTQYQILGTTTNLWYNNNKQAADAQVLDIKQNMALIKAQIDLREQDKNASKDAEEARAKAFEAEKQRWLSIPKLVEEAMKKSEALQNQLLLEVDLLRINPKDVKLEKVPEVEVELTAKPIDDATKALKFLDPFVKGLEQIQKLIQDTSGLTTAIFENETNALETEKNRQLAIAGDNAEKRAKIEKEFAVKKAEVDRKIAAMNKTYAIFDILLQTSKGIQKTIGENGFPAAIPFIALAAATGAAQLAAVISRPLPEIPKFEKGGAVALAGGKIQGGMIVGRRHRQGGVLIEAEGTEYIAKGAAVNKYGVDFFDAANNLELEPFLFKRYIAPALQQATKTIVEIDDEYLAQTFDKGADKIVRAIHQTSKSNNDSAYFKSRYGNYGIA